MGKLVTQATKAYPGRQNGAASMSFNKQTNKSQHRSLSQKKSEINGDLLEHLPVTQKDVLSFAVCKRGMF